VLTLFATLMGAAGLVLAALAVDVARRRGRRMGWSLAALLVAVAWWGIAYAFELSVDDVDVKGRWGDLKYVGVMTLAPAWLTFVLQYTGRGHLVTRRLLGLLAVAPLAMLALLAVPGTHDLVRSYPLPHGSDEVAEVQSGPAFWVSFVYNNLMLVGATALFVVSMVRLARIYQRMAMLLLAAALLPWAANLLHNFDVGWFSQVDLTPFAFTVTGGVLVWGLFRERLVDLAPLARSAVVENMGDAVFVLDAFGRVVDVNPAGLTLAASSRAALLGRDGQQLLDATPSAHFSPGILTLATGRATSADEGERRTFDIDRQPLTDASGRAAGELVVLREVTERVRDRERLEQVLADRSRVAAVLQASMVPSQLPEVPGTELASRYEPAGDGAEIGGDFLDVFALGPQTWAFLLGDVSGKGAEAAAVSAAARYTVRALAGPDIGPADTLRRVNATLLAQTETERHCTLVHGQLERAEGATTLRVTLCLAGHQPPLVLRTTGVVEEVGTLGTSLALFDDPELHDTTFDLAPGEVLCAFTDGLVEARRGGELFGEQRVAEVLHECRHQTTDDIAGAVLDAVRDFHGGTLVDDLAILLVRNVGATRGA
jgi:sigma-B regulation protein RsbU (phosphoserine phosphatase)